MRRVAQAFLFLLSLLLLAIAARPDWAFDFIDSLSTPSLIGIAVLRITFGALLIAAAAKARMPTTLKVLGTLFILGGLFVPIIGVDGIQTMVDDIYGHSAAIMRGAMVFAIAFFGFIGYALSAPKEES